MFIEYNRISIIIMDTIGTRYRGVLISVVVLYTKVGLSNLQVLIITGISECPD